MACELYLTENELFVYDLSYLWASREAPNGTKYQNLKYGKYSNRELVDLFVIHIILATSRFKSITKKWRWQLNGGIRLSQLLKPYTANWLLLWHVTLPYKKWLKMGVGI